ncbi:50S ribosomal protein L19 [Candidatus Daviesbacteria bacterium RIFCSPLOWO2_01_FULL_38_10]|nr:MAG: 50S ribosomal protein L19 [Candidatus Daviesbacteria bacterium RIFCSPHIGHO2_02_FULL_39_41]OGE28653.1 MAG: 50S ribosomal protein L19 [Candidatus Daviesbacteria bacterium RIFCSPHIGHO2_01_FULL_38_8b]OGE37094.1 MAG: 50S ribosomal protein L19 [Candidatus Daviesbacteria bacterium RIFCSPLOWO2_01_FULL_38_10]OGE44520.1 MAG: 50S ribosomal protein L19 [Candidatus Daviesbacteria bacterium RIFCSPHIGHO2_12_FULL_38_25]OGE68219.1 MAG: 50S ribosomal protein L19 [Candidatus Daviesbacteria bacterium RIFCS
MISDKFKETDIHVGDTLRVHSQVKEGEKIRVQVYEGILIRIRGRGENKTFTVRKIGAGGIGVERTWPLDSRSLSKIEVKKKTTGVRRSKLYYLRDLTGRQAVRV